MLNKIKNSFLCKCLQALLIGYFLMSSINLADNFDRLVSYNVATDSIEGMTCNFLKKMFKCDGIAEEQDDYETKDSKTAKLGKSILLLDYLVPVNTSLNNLFFPSGFKIKSYIENPVFSFGFHIKIHLQPPQIIV
ncbi:hypothetical protein ACEN2I_16445 [Flavobacterium sp. W22_SRS_FK3]|uniref:hypothetical protein n=1 Tax=Flavobacterium sp. W22_SRS_FK3 TaxID=3240275 RepID=UPI003F92DF97